MIHSKNIKSATCWIALFFISIFIIQHFFAFIGPFGYDDLEYARLAHLFLNGKADWTEPFTFRFGVIFPLAVSQYFLGVTDDAGAIYPFLISTLTVFLVYWQVNQNWRIKFFAITLSLSCPWMIFYSDKMGADIPVLFYILLSVCILYNHKFTEQWKSKSILSGFLLTLVLFIALLTKETVWFLFPFFFLIFLYDLITQQSIKFWISSIISISLFMSVYLLWQKVQFNDWFYRFNLIKLNDITNLCSYDRQPFEVVFKRITYQLWLHFIKEASFIIPVVMLIAILSKSFFRSILAKENFWTLAALIMVLSANFWSISYSSYHPLCIDVRHYLYIMPFSAIAIANNYQYLFRKWSLIFVISSCTVVLLFSSHLELKPIAIIQLVIITLTFLMILIFKKHREKFLFLLVLLPLSVLYFNIKGASNYQYQIQKKTAINFLKDKRDVAIYTAKTQEGLFKYYLGFENPHHLKIIPYLEFNGVKNGFHFWNYHSLFTSSDMNSIPLEISALSTTENLIYKTDIIKIYKINKSNIKAKEYPLKKSLLWDKGVLANKEIKLDTATEFSPTFKMTLNAEVKSIYVSSRWKLKNHTSKDAFLVFSVDENGKSLFYQNFSIVTDKSAINNLYYLDKKIGIPNLKIKNNAELRVYIWNNLKTELSIEYAKVNLIIQH